LYRLVAEMQPGASVHFALAGALRGKVILFLFFFITLGLELSDTQVYEP